MLTPDAKILVARLDSIGDCILSSSFFIGLRWLFPQARLTGVFGEGSAPLYRDCPIFDHVVTFPLWPVEAAVHLLDPPYDLVICPRWDVDPWGARRLALMVGAPIRVGFDRGPYRHDQPHDGWAPAYFTHLVRVPSDIHEVDKAQEMLRALGASDPAAEPRLWLSAAAGERALELIKARQFDRFVALGVSAAWLGRVWPVENFLRVIDAIGARLPGVRFVVVGGADAASPGAWLQQQRPDAVINVGGVLSVLESAALIARSELYIGMDTGPMHMAAASGVPVVEISCHPRTGSADHPNSPARFGPYAARFHAIQPARPLAPCIDGCTSVGEAHCIRQIQAPDVVVAALDLLGSSAA